MATKTKTVDWGGLTLRVKSLELDATKPGSAGTLVAATGAELNAATDVSARAPIAIADATTYAVLATNSGILHVVPNVTSNITVTLPAAAAGLSYEFIYGGAAADAQNHIFVPTAGFYIGSISHLDTDGTTDEIQAVFSDGDSNDVFTIVTPAAYRVSFVSNGTNWYIAGVTNSATICTIAD